MYYQASADEP